MSKQQRLTIFICEGEKDADRLIEQGLIATSMSGGAGRSIPSDCLKYFKGHDVVIVADNDEPGRKYANRIAAQLFGIAATIKVVEFRELPEHGDVSDFFDAGNSLAQLLARVAATDLWTPIVGKGQTEQASKSGISTPRARYTDLANARELVDRYGDVILYCAAWRCFLVWDDTRWVRDDLGQAALLAKNIADIRWEQAQQADNNEARRFALRTASSKGIESMLRLVQSEERIVVRPDQFDTDPLVLNCPNGTLDLRTGKLYEARREDFITKQCPTPFNPRAHAPAWISALNLIFGGDAELIGFFRRLVGYCLTGLVSEQVLVLFIGTGSNGKSLILLVLLQILGADYAIKASDDILLRRLSQSHPTALADLFGVRLAVVLETDAGDRLAEALIKALTGGDRVRARRMREDFWEFLPTHKIFLSTNHRPHVESTDHAFWRRIRLIPFNVTFWKEGDPGNEGKRLAKHLKADPNLAEKLMAEAEGILAWCVQGCLEWQQHGLGTTQAVATATESYRREQDGLSRFIDDACVIDAAVRISSSVLYARYRGWCELNGEHALPQNQFKQRLLEQPLGITFKRSDGSWFVGIKPQTK